MHRICTISEDLINIFERKREIGNIVRIGSFIAASSTNKFVESLTGIRTLTPMRARGEGLHNMVSDFHFSQSVTLNEVSKLHQDLL